MSTALRLLLDTPGARYRSLAVHCSYAIVRFDEPENLPSVGGFYNASTLTTLFTFTAPAENVFLPRFDTSVVVRDCGIYFCI